MINSNSNSLPNINYYQPSHHDRLEGRSKSPTTSINRSETSPNNFLSNTTEANTTQLLIALLSLIIQLISQLGQKDNSQSTAASTRSGNTSAISSGSNISGVRSDAADPPPDTDDDGISDGIEIFNNGSNAVTIPLSNITDRNATISSNAGALPVDSEKNLKRGIITTGVDKFRTHRHPPKPVVMIPANLLVNDTGTNLQIVSYGQPGNGALTFDSAGDITSYIPDSNLVNTGGVDSFTYTVEDDDQDHATGTVTIAVATQGAEGIDDSATTIQGQSIDIDVLANDIDGIGMASNNFTLGSLFGNDTFNDDGAYDQAGNRVGQISVLSNNQMRFVPDPLFTGEASFVYRLFDNVYSNGTPPTATTATATVNVLPIKRDDGGSGSSDPR